MYALKGYADLVLDIIRSLADNLTSNSDKMFKMVKDLQTEQNTTQVRVDHLIEAHTSTQNKLMDLEDTIRELKLLIRDQNKTRASEVQQETWTHEVSKVPIDKKISVIRIIRELTGWDLKTAKEMTETLIMGGEYPTFFKFKDSWASYYDSTISAARNGMASELFRELGCEVNTL